jgi:superfamily II DNA/RNA helicase
LLNELAAAPADTDDADDAAQTQDGSETASAADEAGFAELGLSEPVLRAVAEKGYLVPTPIQREAIPVILMGRDVLGTAQTGTGKTAGFTLPMLDILAGTRSRARMPRALILEPTRELALQVSENFVAYGQHLKLLHALLIGGESMAEQREALARGADVLIATPGRLLDLIERGGLLMTDVKFLVIDEADRMLDMGFIPDVERIVGMLPRIRQTLFFSATMAPEIKRLADAFLQNPKLIAVSPPASVATTITQGLALVAEHDKREALRRLVRTEDVQNALVFCNRKRDVDVLHKSLVSHKFSAGALHGDMTQPMRFATLERFKAGEIRLLVCSDVAARGLDIGGLSHVFNFDVPHHAEDYVHRIGRTGRAGREGRAFTLATPEDRLAVEAIEKLIGLPIPRILVEGLDPVVWAEGDGRRRRGRAPARASSRTPARPPVSGEGAERAPRAPRPPRAARAARSGQTELVIESQAVGEALEPVERPDEGERGVSVPRPERAPRRERAPRAEPAVSAGRAPRRERSGEPRREPAVEAASADQVRGFGEQVPAFMLLASRRKAAPAVASIEGEP